jgi:hypothetical protein
MDSNRVGKSKWYLMVLNVDSLNALSFDTLGREKDSLIPSD